MPRKNVLLLLPLKYTYAGILPDSHFQKGPMYTRLWFFRDHIHEKETRVKHGGHMVGSYDPFAEVVVISYKPRGANTVDNFICMDGLYKNLTRFIELECA